MKKQYVVGLTGFMAAAVMCQAGPLKRGYVDGDASVVAHLDVEQFKQTAVGAWVEQEMRRPEAENKFGALRAILNFDPRSDLASLSVYAWGKDDGVMLLEGAFDAERAVTLLKAATAYESSQYAGQTIHSWVEKKERVRPAMRAAAARTTENRHYGAFLPSGLLVLSEKLDSVQKAMDVVQGRRAALAAQSPLNELIPAGNVPFFIAGADLTRMAPQQNQSATFDGIASGSITAGEQADRFSLEATLLAKDETAAGRIQSVVQGILALGAMSAQRNPAGAELAQSVSSTVTGRTLRLALDYPAQGVVKMLSEKRPPAPAGPGAVE